MTETALPPSCSRQVGACSPRKVSRSAGWTVPRCSPRRRARWAGSVAVSCAISAVACPASRRPRRMRRDQTCPHRTLSWVFSPFRWPRRARRSPRPTRDLRTGRNGRRQTQSGCSARREGVGRPTLLRPTITTLRSADFASRRGELVCANFRRAERSAAGLLAGDVALLCCALGPALAVGGSDSPDVPGDSRWGVV